MFNIETEVNGKKLTIETGVMARQSDGSAVVKYGDTVVLATAVAEKKTKEGIDFFPLTMDYQEKAYSAGKIPGGFFKREGRPSEKEVLTSRLTDRPIRPLFPKGFRSETQGIVSVLSLGEENASDVMGIIGVSAALMISDIPFDGPVSAVRVGRKGGAFLINPDLQDEVEMDMDVVVAGTDEAIVMVEGRADEAGEADFLEALDLAHAEIRKINAAQRALREKAGKPKRELVLPQVDEAFKEKVRAFAIEGIEKAIRIPDKLRRQEAVAEILASAKEHFKTEEADRSKEVADVCYDIEKTTVRGMVINEGRRADGRKPDEIRPITCSVGLLPRTHGSALFVRGETQALAVTTLGTSQDEQKIDALEGEYYKTFMLHYNFPPFSVGEVKFLRGPGRREVGHGNLAERATGSVIPSKDIFPYTIRVVSDVLESNGSSSMATVCAATLSLMDAGVPIKSPVAGIAMGLITDKEKTVILTDILGLEDHLGDMDFKVTGTEKGITAFQMDVKVAGITRAVLEGALEQARKGRLFILDKMKETLAGPREGLSPFAPRIYTMQVKQDKIREVIGSGGKVIKGIIEETGCKIDIDDTGLIHIASADADSAQRAIKIIEGIVEEAELGRVYDGRVVRITDFGAFVEILPGTDGLVHISQIAEKRIANVTDVLTEGDEVQVKVIEIDKQGRVRLTMKGVPQKSQKGPQG